MLAFYIIILDFAALPVRMITYCRPSEPHHWICLYLSSKPQGRFVHPAWGHKMARCKVMWGDSVRGIMACASTGQIWTTWSNAVRRYHKEQQDRPEPLDGMLSDVTTNSSRTDLNHLMECCQTLTQTAAVQIWTTWWNAVRRYHKQQQDRPEPLDGMLSDVTTNSSRAELNHLMECCQTLPQTAAGQSWTTWWISSHFATTRRSSYVAESVRTQRPHQGSRSPKSSGERTAFFIPTKDSVIGSLYKMLSFQSQVH
jgi:hypothetical protein